MRPSNLTLHILSSYAWLKWSSNALLHLLWVWPSRGLCCFHLRVYVAYHLPVFLLQNPRLLAALAAFSGLTCLRLSTYIIAKFVWGNSVSPYFLQILQLLSKIAVWTSWSVEFNSWSILDLIFTCVYELFVLTLNFVFVIVNGMCSVHQCYFQPYVLTFVY